MNYMTASEWIDAYPESFEDTPPYAVSAMRESNVIWEVHWYPDTPIGFYNCYRATLDEAIYEAIDIDAQDKDTARRKTLDGGGA